jgi:ankyrin repeat protein
MRLPLGAGVDVVAKDKDGFTLRVAALIGHAALVRLLLDHGTDINTRDAYGETALHAAACRGNEGTFLLLLDRGADVNAKGEYKQTALLASRGTKWLVRLLFAYGADIHMKSKPAQTLLGTVASGGNEAAVQLLLDYGS